jgi:hypothetical protein
MTTATPPVTSLDKSTALRLNIAIAEHVLGWRWYVLTPGHIAKLRERRAFDFPEDQLHGARFLGEPMWGAHQVDIGEWEPAPADAPTSRALDRFVLTVCELPGTALRCLERCEFYRVHRTGKHYEVSCSRSDVGSPIGHAEARDFPLAAALALARAWRLQF